MIKKYSFVILTTIAIAPALASDKKELKLCSHQDAAKTLHDFFLKPGSTYFNTKIASTISKIPYRTDHSCYLTSEQEAALIMLGGASQQDLEAAKKQRAALAKAVAGLSDYKDTQEKLDPIAGYSVTLHQWTKNAKDSDSSCSAGDGKQLKVTTYSFKRPAALIELGSNAVFIACKSDDENAELQSPKAEMVWS